MLLCSPVFTFMIILAEGAFSLQDSHLAGNNGAEQRHQEGSPVFFSSKVEMLDISTILKTLIMAKKSVILPPFPEAPYIMPSLTPINSIYAHSFWLRLDFGLNIW